MSPRSPIQNLPAQVFIASVEARLNGKITRLDSSTLSIFDAIPSTERGYDYIEIVGHSIEMVDEGLYRAQITLNLFSSYLGFKEVNSILEQVNNFLASPLRDLTGFTDVSEGGEFQRAIATKQENEAGEIIRQITYTREWQIADNKF